MLVELAQQFGYATGTGKALRSALGRGRPERRPRHVRSSRTSAARSWSARSSTPSSRTYQNRIARPRPHRDRRLRPAAARRPASRSREPRWRTRRRAGRPLPAHVHPRLRLPAAGRRHLRRLPARAGHRRLRAQPRGSDEVRYGDDRGLPRRGIYPTASSRWPRSSLLWPNQVNGPIPQLESHIMDLARQLLARSATALDQVGSPRRKRRTRHPDSSRR